MKNSQPILKHNLHPLNIHKSGYDYELLVKKHPPLENYLIDGQFNLNIDFSDYQSVISLNAALLKTYYRIDHWQIPNGYLCPPIPGRVDYIHYLAELLDTSFAEISETKHKKTLDHSKVQVLDIGTGASCIYPILGQRCYQWSFSASDIDPVSVSCAKELIKFNKGLAKHISIERQKNEDAFFDGIIKQGQTFDLTLCNPPFHSSIEKALSGNARKRDNLKKSSPLTATSEPKTALNFGGQKAELFCKGGELIFIQKMMRESVTYKNQVLFFSCLVSKKAHLHELKASLKKLGASYIKDIRMSQGQKISHFIVWSFLSKNARDAWLLSKKSD